MTASAVGDSGGTGSLVNAGAAGHRLQWPRKEDDDDENKDEE